MTVDLMRALERLRAAVLAPSPDGIQAAAREVVGALPPPAGITLFESGNFRVSREAEEGWCRRLASLGYAVTMATDGRCAWGEEGRPVVRLGGSCWSVQLPDGTHGPEHSGPPNMEAIERALAALLGSAARARRPEPAP